MARRKKEKEFIYCDNRECNERCLRWYQNAPFDELIKVARYEIKKGVCKNRVSNF